MTARLSKPVNPWARLPKSLSKVLRPALPSLIERTTSAIAVEVPAYGDMESEIGPIVQLGVDIALNRMVDLFGTNKPALDERSEKFCRDIGAVESEHGRSLESLLGAYRTGARLAWEHMAAAATEAGISTEHLITLAEAIFVYIDQLSAASAEGHAEADAARTGRRDVVRTQLVEALLDGEAASDPVRVNELCDAAAWSLPAKLAVAISPIDPASGRPPVSVLPPDVLLIQRSDTAIAILPDPSGPGRRKRLERLVADFPVYVGTVRTPQETPLSLAHATRIRQLAESGRIPNTGAIPANDYLPELIITADSNLLAELSRRSLKPLEDVADTKRQTLLETLTAWLDLQGDRAAMAAQLSVHPQTISYRMTKLNELFGDALRDPRKRLALQLALA